jgi:hypothetical protein
MGNTLPAKDQAADLYNLATGVEEFKIKDKYVRKCRAN